MNNEKIKLFAINKVGYTSGVYGCSGEYFNLVVFNGEKLFGCTFNGMYGAESIISSSLKELGYNDIYLPMNTYGKLTKKDIMKTYSEYTLLNYIKEFLDNGYIELDEKYRLKAGLTPIKK